jgi:hypothetical protein
MATVAVISRKRETIDLIQDLNVIILINDSYFFAEDHARRILPLVFL